MTPGVEPDDLPAAARQAVAAAEPADTQAARAELEALLEQTVPAGRAEEPSSEEIAFLMGLLLGQLDDRSGQERMKSGGCSGA